MNQDVIVVGKAQKYLAIIKAILRYKRTRGIHRIDLQDLYANGYRPGVPTLGLVDASEIDSSVCNESTCDACGHQGLDYKPFIKDELRSYRAFAVCPRCGSSFEF